MGGLGSIAIFLIVPLLHIVLLPAQVGAALTYDIYNETTLDHSRDSTGDFYFGPLPPDSDAPEEITNKTMVVVFQFFSDLAYSIVDSVQTQEFPYDLLRRIMRNDYEESEVIAYQTNIIVTCAVIAVVVAITAVVIIIYTVLYIKKRRRDPNLLRKQLFDQKRGRILIIITFFLGVINLTFLMMSLLVSTYTNTAVTEMDSDVVKAMDGISGYFNQTGEQWDFMSNDTNIWSLLTVLKADVEDIGSIIWQPAVQAFAPDLAPPFAATANLDSELAEAVGYLTSMQNQINAILAGTGGDLTPVMNEIYYNLSFARNDFTCFGCDGSCAGCSDIVVDDIYFNMDFTKLTNVTSNLITLTAMMDTTIANSLISPQYYFWKGVGDYIESQSNVSWGMNGLIASLEQYSESITNSTSAIPTPSEEDLKFDRLRGDWNTWIKSTKGMDTARYAFHVIFALVNIVLLMLLYFGWSLLVMPGLVKIDAKDDNFKLPRRIIMICLIVSLCLFLCLLALAISGFYSGANTDKVICEPAKDGRMINETLDYLDAIPGHSGYYLSSIMLSNGSLFPLYVTDTLATCRSNNTTAYETFSINNIEPNIYQDLNHSQFFPNSSEHFSSMLVSLDNVTLVPPLLESWYANFTSVAHFNFTEYSEFLAKGVITAVLTTYVNNLLTVYGHAYPDGPMEPAKTRLYEVAQSLLGEESNLNTMTALKTNISTAITYLRGQDSTIQGLSAGYIASVTEVGPCKTLAICHDIVYDTFCNKFSPNVVTEVGPCKTLAICHDIVYDTFCNKFSPNVNATWMLVGTTSFFLLLVGITTFLLFREIPQEAGDEMEDDLDITGCCCCMGSSRNSGKKYETTSRAQTAASSSGRRRSSCAVGVAPLATRHG
ncbi:prominin-1-a [Plakobranchus ocellatus]|uniref:Prominin-1-a n=1 Tax=Plakobranchus ocellatus TaxID=259542 RepID=A0AAV4C3D2_9GAST|nr:prominin-1-a [Plakobranchus ocellatus]